MPEITLDDVKQAIDKHAGAWHEEVKTLKTGFDEVKKNGQTAAETKEKLVKIEADVTALVEIKTQFAQMERALKRLGNLTENKGKELPEDHKEVKDSYHAFLRKGKDSTDGREWAPKNAKSLSIISDPDGGYSVPTDVSGRTVERVFETSPIRAYAAVQQISGPELEGVYDDNEFAQGWVSETGSRAATSNAQLGRWKFAVHEQYAYVQASQQLLDDSAMDIEGWVTRKLGDKFSRSENDAFCNGDGVSKPQGFLTLASGTTLRTQIEQIKSGSNGVPTYAGLVQLLYGLKDPYRQRAVWAGHRSTWSTVRQLVDSYGRPLWEMSLQAGQPDRLFGLPVAQFNDMPVPATSALCLALADWQEAYQVADRLGIRMLRDPYSAKPFVVFYATKRTGGKVINTEAIKLQPFNS